MEKPRVAFSLNRQSRSGAATRFWATGTDACSSTAVCPGTVEVAMSARFRLCALTFSDGTTIPVPPDGVLVIVGPNNAGKSATLREILSLLSTIPGPDGPSENVLTTVDLMRDGSPEDLVSWLEQHAYTMERPDGRHFRRRGGGADGQESALVAQWGSAPTDRNQWGSFHPARTHVPLLAQFFVFHASADQRLALLNGSQPHNPVVDAPSNPMQALFANPSIEERLSEICDEAFGAPLHLSRLMGAELNLYVGAPSAAC